MSFPKNPEVIYILVSIKLHIGNDMDQGHYVCDVLDYYTGTWWNCDDEKVTEYPGYPMNVYNDLSRDKKQKIGKRQDMDGSDRIVSMLYILKKIPEVITYYFITGKSVSKDMEHIKEIIAVFGTFKEEARGIKITYNTILKVFNYGRSIWKP